MLNDLAFLLATSLMYGTPLLYAALGGVMTENAGVINIGLEGIMTLGAFVGAWIAFATGNAFAAFLAAGLAGGLLALLHAVVSVTFRANQIISGTALNFIGPGVAIFMSRKLFEGSAQTTSLDIAKKLPKPLLGVFTENSFADILLSQDASVFIAMLLVAIIWFLLYKTKYGLWIRACGEHPKAASTLGIHVRLIRYICTCASGVLAGFGGATMSIAVASNFFPALISGHGFIALAAMIFGRWKPQGALLGCLMFGFSKALVVLLGTKNIVISPSLLNMLPYVITIAVLMSLGKKASGPAASGLPY